MLRFSKSCKILKIHEKILTNLQAFFIDIVLYCKKEKMLTDRAAQLKVEIELKA